MVPEEAGAPPPFIVGVIDLLEGRAVHARGGQRKTYQPVDVPQAAGGDAVALARFYADVAGLADVYVADLHAIAGSAWHVGAIQAIRQCVRALWLDAGIATQEDVERARTLGASRVIVGLETLPSIDSLREICTQGGTDIVFSLDLREGRNITTRGIRSDLTPPAIAMQAEDAGVRTMIVLDVARVGTGRGCDLGTIAAVRAAVPSVTLLAGGGVRDAADIARLAEAGCDGVLMATALLNGTLPPALVRSTAR